MIQQPPLQHSKTSDNKDNSLKIAERVIATTKSVNEILNERLKSAEALCKKLGFDLDQAKKKARSESNRYNELLKYSENLNNLCKEIKLRAEFAEAKSNDFDKKLDAVKSEHRVEINTYRNFLKFKKILPDYDHAQETAEPITKEDVLNAPKTMVDILQVPSL